MKRTLTLLLVSLAVLLVPTRADAATVQPGDASYSSVGQCTLGFLADGAGGPFFLTAAHCVKNVGESIRLADDSVIGTVAARGNPNNSLADWALIQVLPGRAGQVSAVVRGHRAPSGVAGVARTNIGDVLDHSGHGIPWSIAAPLREQRAGVLTGQDLQIWWSVGLDTFGDSGGPVLHRASGGALGIVSRLCVGVCTSEGPTVEGILPQAQAAGYPITLRTF